ncbi:MAG: hypothetical protein WBD63_00180 [Phycisphaerae bacterium]
MTTGKKVLVWCIVAAGVFGIPVGSGVLYLCWDEPPPDDSDLDVVRHEIPDSENALNYFTEAAAKVWEPQDGYSEVCDETGEPQTQQEWYEAMLADECVWNDEVADEVLARNVQTFERVEEGMACPHFQVTEMDVATEMGDESLFGMLRVVNILRLRTRALYRAGREEQAVNEAFKIVRLGHRIENGRGFFFHVTVGGMAKSVGLTLLQQLATEMNLQPERAMALATELKKCHLDRDAVAESLRVDYQVTARAIEETKAEKTGVFSDRGFLENPPPLLYLKVHETKRRYAEFTRLQIENLSKPYAEMVRFETLDQPSRRGLWGKLTTPNSLGKEWLSRLDAKYLPRCCCMFDAEVAATRLLLSLKAYNARAGRLPERLDELV